MRRPESEFVSLQFSIADLKALLFEAPDRKRSIRPSVEVRVSSRRGRGRLALDGQCAAVRRQEAAIEREWQSAQLRAQRSLGQPRNAARTGHAGAGPARA